MDTRSTFARLFPGNVRPAPLQSSLPHDSKMSSVGFLSAEAAGLCKLQLHFVLLL